MPDSVRNILLIAILAGTAWGGAKALMYFNAKHAVDQFIEENADKANITYGGISTELAGAVAVNAIRIRPWDSDDALGIDRIRLDTRDPWFFISGQEWIPGESAPPKSMSLAIDGLRLDLNSAWFKEMRDSLPAQAGQAGDAADACAGAPGMQFDAGLLADLGLDELVFDAELRYDLDEATERLDASFSMMLENIQSTEATIELGGLNTEALAGGSLPAVELVELGLSIRVEPEFGQRMFRLCAQRRNQSLEDYTDQMYKQAIDNATLSGVDLGPGLKDAIAAFYTDWGNLEFSARPADPMGMLSIAFLPPEQLADALGLRMSVNNTPITDTSFSWVHPQQGDVFARLLSDADEFPATQVPAEEYRRIRIERSYRKVAPPELEQHLNSDVRIQQIGQPMRVGRLIGVRNGEVQVQQRMHGGKFTAHIPVAEIASAEVEIVRRVEIKRD